MSARDFNVAANAEQASEHGSNTKQYGPQDAYLRMMDDVNGARQASGSGSSQCFANFTNALANDLYGKQALRDMNMEWLKDNLERFDFSGNHKLNAAEINWAMNTSTDAFDKEMLREVGQELQINHKSSISAKDADHIEKGWEAQKDKADQLALDQQRLQDTHSGNSSYMSRLIQAPNGDAGQSLFAVLDDVKGGHPDGRISKGDLKKYLKEYDLRASHGDNGSLNFTSADRSYVQTLLNRWDAPEVVALRGTHKVQGSDGYYDRDQANSYITTDSLKQAAGIPSYGKLFI